MKTYTFEKLECWKHAKDLAVWIYAATNGYPAEEKFGIVSQMRRAAISIASNLAEGTSRSSKKVQAHFSTLSYSNAIELLNDIIISMELNYLSKEQYNEGRRKIEFQTYLIAMLRRNQLY